MARGAAEPALSGGRRVSSGFVPGGKGLIWRFLAAGEDVGAPGRWDVIQGYAFAFPWRSHGWKLVFVPEATAAYTSWTVLDPHDNSVVDSYWTASDAAEVVTVLYEVRGLGMRYARFDTALAPAAATEVARTKRGQTLRAITGTLAPMISQ